MASNGINTLVFICSKEDPQHKSLPMWILQSIIYHDFVTKDADIDIQISQGVL